MIKHIVMWELVDGAQGQTARENAVLMKERLEALVKKVPDIIRLEVGIALDFPAGGPQVVLVSEFNDRAALQRYLDHPEHKAVAEFVSQIRQARWVVDYEV